MARAWTVQVQDSCSRCCDCRTGSTSSRRIRSRSSDQSQAPGACLAEFCRSSSSSTAFCWSGIMLPAAAACTSLITQSAVASLPACLKPTYCMCVQANKGFLQSLSHLLPCWPPNRWLLCMLCLLCIAPCCCSDKQAIDCLKQAGWSVEGGIEVFFSLGMQGGSVLDTRAIEQLYLKYKGAPAAAACSNGCSKLACSVTQDYMVA
jgi:hypothetical protein